MRRLAAAGPHPPPRHPPPRRAAVLPAPGLPPVRRAILPAPSGSSARGSPTPRPRPPRSGPAPVGSSTRRRPRRAAQHAPRCHGQRPRGGGGHAGGRAASESRALDPADGYGDTDAEALAAVAALYAPPLLAEPCLSGSPAMYAAGDPAGPSSSARGSADSSLARQ
ncbi:hypothetical protein VPH35_016642 [Triticum aestivum]